VAIDQGAILHDDAVAFLNECREQKSGLAQSAEFRRRSRTSAEGNDCFRVRTFRTRRESTLTQAK
jgi:hypothetical protein